eukprot:gene6327-12802_t
MIPYIFPKLFVLPQLLLILHFSLIQIECLKRDESEVRYTFYEHDAAFLSAKSSMDRDMKFQKNSPSIAKGTYGITSKHYKVAGIKKLDNAKDNIAIGYNGKGKVDIVGCIYPCDCSKSFNDPPIFKKENAKENFEIKYNGKGYVYISSPAFTCNCSSNCQSFQPSPFPIPSVSPTSAQINMNPTGIGTDNHPTSSPTAGHLSHLPSVASLWPSSIPSESVIVQQYPTTIDTWFPTTEGTSQQQQPQSPPSSLPSHAPFKPIFSAPSLEFPSVSPSLPTSSMKTLFPSSGIENMPTNAFNPSVLSSSPSKIPSVSSSPDIPSSSSSSYAPTLTPIVSVSTQPSHSPSPSSSPYRSNSPYPTIIPSSFRTSLSPPPSSAPYQNTVTITPTSMTVQSASVTLVMMNISSSSIQNNTLVGIICVESVALTLQLMKDFIAIENIKWSTNGENGFSLTTATTTTNVLVVAKFSSIDVALQIQSNVLQINDISSLFNRHVLDGTLQSKIRVTSRKYRYKDMYWATVPVLSGIHALENPFTTGCEIPSSWKRLYNSTWYCAWLGLLCLLWTVLLVMKAGHYCVSKVCRKASDAGDSRPNANGPLESDDSRAVIDVRGFDGELHEISLNDDPRPPEAPSEDAIGVRIRVHTASSALLVMVFSQVVYCILQLVQWISAPESIGCVENQLSVSHVVEGVKSAFPRSMIALHLLFSPLAVVATSALLMAYEPSFRLKDTMHGHVWKWLSSFKHVWIFVVVFVIVGVGSLSFLPNAVFRLTWLVLLALYGTLLVVTGLVFSGRTIGGVGCHQLLFDAPSTLQRKNALIHACMVSFVFLGVLNIAISVCVLVAISPTTDIVLAIVTFAVRLNELIAAVALEMVVRSCRRNEVTRQQQPQQQQQLSTSPPMPSDSSSDEQKSNSTNSSNFLGPRFVYAFPVNINGGERLRPSSTGIIRTTAYYDT